MGLFLILTFVFFLFLTIAIYSFVSRDTDEYRRRIDERLRQLVQDRGGVSQREVQLLKEELLSTVPALHRMLIRFEFLNNLQTILRQADLKISVYRFLTGSLIAGFIVGLLAFLFSGSLAAMMIATGLMMGAPLSYALSRRRRRFRTFLE